MKKLLIFFVVFLFNISFAQLSVSISAGFDPKEISLYDRTAIDGDNAYWNNGITFGINYDYSLSEKLFISALFQYSQYNFDRFSDTGIRIPEIRFISVEGENLKLWRTSIDAKYFPFPEKRFKFFVLSGIGLVFENFGTIKTTYFDMSQNEYFINKITSVKYTRFVHSLGLGVRTNIISNLFVDISGSYYSDYSERFQTFLGLNLGYQIF